MKKVTSSLLPYQLPSCVQFVYADLDQTELDRMPQRVVPREEHVPAVGPTAGYVRDLAANVNSYPELARMLRLSEERYVEGWLPPNDGEPNVAPLQRGTGQFPTVGRAALFGTFLGGGRGLLAREIQEAVGRLFTSGEDLYIMGGRAAKDGRRLRRVLRGRRHRCRDLL